MSHSIRLIAFPLIFGIAFVSAAAQRVDRAFTITPGGRVEVTNLYGRVEAITDTEMVGDSIEAKASAITVTATSPSAISGSDIKITSSGGELKVDVKPADTGKRIDISIKMPPKMRVRVETREGEVRVSGGIISADVHTTTGTIAADVPTDDVRYGLYWTASRPRFLSDFTLMKVKEKAAGRFQITGRYSDADVEKAIAGKTSSREKNTAAGAEDTIPPTEADVSPDKSSGGRKEKTRKNQYSATVSLNLTTDRGIILLNIPPDEVTGDLRERPLTMAAKAIIRSGDSLLMESIRRAAPKYYSDYARTLPPVKLEPTFADRSTAEKGTFASVKTATVRVNDLNNRAVSGLEPKDFDLIENNQSREIISVEPATAPFNLVLLLDVSGSVDNYVNFIRKAARSFINTVDARDRISIVTFNDDVKVLTPFTTDKRVLSESLDTFDAGGATAYYDALAFTLAETLRPLKGARTAIVVLTDGDDNRSFLPFDSMLASIQESGALIYPLYVPSGLIAASESSPNAANAAVDALRTRYLQGELTSKAAGEGERLAQVSGGVYYPITRLSQIQSAYDDIVAQLRTAYTVKFRSDTIDSGTGASPRIKVKINKPNAFATVTNVSIAR